MLTAMWIPLESSSRSSGQALRRPAATPRRRARARPPQGIGFVPMVEHMCMQCAGPAARSTQQKGRRLASQNWRRAQHTRGLLTRDWSAHCRPSPADAAEPHGGATAGPSVYLLQEAQITLLLKRRPAPADQNC